MKISKNKKLQIILIIIVIFFIIHKLFLLFFGFFQHRGDSMNPTLQSGKYLIIDKITYKLRNPERGELIILELKNKEDTEFFIKRIIGLPGETIRISHGKVFIKTKNSENFIELEENYLLEKNSTYFFENYSETDFDIPENHYWVMGDNRMNSSDSRNCFKYTGCTKNEEHFLNQEKIHSLARF